MKCGIEMITFVVALYLRWILMGVFVALRYLALTCLDMEDMDFQRIED